MEKKKRNYLLIGILTLVISTIGATFAYFTATASNNNTITGNMASIGFDVDVVKMTNVDTSRGGLIPMSNNMTPAAITNASNKGICVDNNDNAVCQIYKITVTNNSSASIFVDGYVDITGGSGVPTDVPDSSTTMRWAQAFCTEENNTISSCTAGGNSTINADNTLAISALTGDTSGANAHNTSSIKTAYNDVTGTTTISGNTYDAIDTNYIRISGHTGNAYTKDNDVTSALVYNQYLDSQSNNTSSMYIVVWLSENGHNQTVGAANAATNANNFFRGTVTFNSAEGSEVSATFGGYTKVGENNQTPTSVTKYTVNIPDDFDNMTTTNPKLVWIDNPIPSGVTLYDTASAARAAFSNNPFYLKHKIENDIVTESYVEFVVTPEMASANSGMTSGTYTLRGAGATSNGSGGYNNDSPYYAANVNVLKQAFGENSGYCSDFTSSSSVDCVVSGLGANAYSNGGVYANDASAYCGVDPDGDSSCGS